MNKKAFTFIFTLVSTLVNIILTLAIIILLAVLTTVIFRFVFKIALETHQGVYLTALMICGLGGMVLGMFLFAKISGFVVSKYNLEKKLDARLIGKYVPGAKQPLTAQDDEPKQKTVMPDSVLPKKDKWAEDIYSGEAPAEDSETEILSADTLKKNQ